jgi:hypothetical protein
LQHQLYKKLQKKLKKINDNKIKLKKWR